jgi:hypothetical protein
MQQYRRRCFPFGPPWGYTRKVNFVSYEDWLDLSGVFILKVTNRVASNCLRLKVRWKEEQTNWTVKYNLCCRMSNKPRITTDFYKLQWIPKFTDNERITGTDICIFVSIFVHICVNFFRRCYTRFGAYPNYIHMKMFVKTTCKSLEKTAQIGTNVRARVFNVRLLVRSQFASGRSCDRPTRSRFSVFFLGPRVNAELVPKFHVSLHACNINNFALMYPS